MTAQTNRNLVDFSKPDTPNGTNAGNFALGNGNLWDCIQTMGIGVFNIVAGTATLTQANAGLSLIDATSGNIIINLPACSAAIGALFQFKRLDASANTVTINRAGGDTIDGATSFGLVGQFDFQEIRSDGVSAWRPLNSGRTAIPRGQIAGLTMSTAGASATMSVAAGQATDSANVALMTLAATSKTTSSWALGAAVGGLDTGAIAINTWYHFYVIRRPDTGVVDVTFSTNATTPTLPTNYTQYRRIGSGKTNASSQWTKFYQSGDNFRWDTPVLDVNITAVASAALTTFTVPLGVQVRPHLAVSLGMSGAFSNSGLVGNIGSADNVNTVVEVVSIFNGPNNSQSTGSATEFISNTSAQLYFSLANSGVPSLASAPAAGAASPACVIRCRGWTDTRGRDA